MKFKIIKWLVLKGLEYLYDHIDNNGDGKIDKKEIDEFFKQIKKITKKKR